MSKKYSNIFYAKVEKCKSYSKLVKISGISFFKLIIVNDKIKII